MKIEDEIKQRTFNSEYHKLAVNILFTANWLKAKENKIFRPVWHLSAAIATY